MELADRPQRERRANAGNRLHELLQNGLDSEEEKILQAFSDATSDSSYRSSSDDGFYDVIDSDFSDEEVNGTLEGETVETEASIRRADRSERAREKQKRLQRSQNFSNRLAKTSTKAKRKLHKNQCDMSTSGMDGATSSDEGGGEELRPVVRQRREPTIPLQERLALALERAAVVKSVGEEYQLKDDGMVDAGNIHHESEWGLGKCNMGSVSRRKSLRRSSATRRLAATGTVAMRAHGKGDGASGKVHHQPQRVCYSSGASILKAYGVPTIVSFSRELPSLFSSK